MLFTVLASGMLCVLYLFKDQLMKLVEVQVSFGAFVCLTILIDQVIGASPKVSWLAKESVKIPELLTGEKDSKLAYSTIVSMLISLSFVVPWYLTRNWVLNNIIGCAMSIVFIKVIQLNKIDPALIFLSLLFIYDIFWVFLSPSVFPQGKSVMVEVAMAYNIPNKLIMPAILNPEGRNSMLGLGDIVIPGVYLSYLDNLGKMRNTDAYFNAGLIAYAVSFLQCAFVIMVFDSAQPVLLYIVPCLFIATYKVARKRHELHMIRDIDVNSTEKVEQLKEE